MIVLGGYKDGQELAPHLETAAEKSHRLITIDGTNQPETRETPGLITAARMFLREQPQWSVVSHRQENNGLTVLCRDERDKPQLPGKIEMAANFAQAGARHVADGATKIDQATLERRLEICTVCEHRIDDRCSVCGCYLAEKAAWRTSECPLGKWAG